MQKYRITLFFLFLLTKFKEPIRPPGNQKYSLKFTIYYHILYRQPVSRKGIYYIRSWSITCVTSKLMLLLLLWQDVYGTYYALAQASCILLNASHVGGLSAAMIYPQCCRQSGRRSVWRGMIACLRVLEEDFHGRACDAEHLWSAFHTMHMPGNCQHI